MAKQFCVARTQQKGKGHWNGGKCVATLNATESVLNRSWDSYHDLQLLITASVNISTFLTAHLSRYVYMQSELKKNTYTKHHMSIWRNVIKLNQVSNCFREKQKFERRNVKGVQFKWRRKTRVFDFIGILIFAGWSGLSSANVQHQREVW